MSENYLLVVFGCGVLGFVFTLATVLIWRIRRDGKPRYVRPYMGDFVPAEPPRMRFQRERLSAWRAMIRDPDL
jgi:hypothetical protein